jgi:alkanesulfonate monooxygenase SsuD/methylene tetrahydromethanopterin reductase-like flavin-dependent oxidoreductase (luciferase family)
VIPLRFTISYNTAMLGTDPDRLAGCARHAEECGFEALDVLRTVWSGGADGVSHDGEFFSSGGLVSYPKPHAATTLPIHVAGST